jgi:hypothetical protein
MKHFLLKLLTLLSVILCATAVLLWAASLVRVDGISHYNGNSVRMLLSDRGAIKAFRYHSGSSYGGGWSHYSSAAVEEPEWGHPSMIQFLGFGWFLDAKSQHSPGSLIPEWTFIVPYWFLVLLSSLLPIRWVLARRRLRGRGFQMELTPNAGPDQP